MEKIKKVIPTKSFFRGIIFAIAIMQFWQVRIEVTETTNYEAVENAYLQATGGIDVEQEVADISVVPEVFSVVGE